MKFLQYLVLAVAAILIAAALPVVAMAQESDTTVNVGQLLAPWLELLVGAVVTLALALLAYLTALIKAKTGIDIGAKHRETLQAAVENAAGLVLAKVQGSLADKTIDVRHPLVRDAIMYVNANAPDAVAHWGLSGDAIAEKILAKIGLATAKQEKKVLI